MNFWDFFRSRYVRSLEQQIAELKAEKASQRTEIERLQRLLVPGLRQMDREEKQAALPLTQRASRETKIIVEDETKKGKVERMPPVRSWQQAKAQAEHLSQKQSGE